MIIHGPGVWTRVTDDEATGFRRFVLPCCGRPPGLAEPGIVTSDPTRVTCAERLPRVYHDGEIFSVCRICWTILVRRETHEGWILSCPNHGDVVVQITSGIQMFMERFDGFTFVGIEP